MDKLKSGKIPQEYKEITEKSKKTYSAKQSFIQDKQLKQEYENRSYASMDRPIEMSNFTIVDGRPRTGQKNSGDFTRN